jgi:ribosomal 50S subunit-recycling heat shock protein
MKFKRNLLILSAILIGVLIAVAGCMPAPTTPPAEEEDVPSGGTISIAYGAAATNDATPPLTISATGADHMAFSGNGTTWSSWVVYATSHSTFNITTGAGCTTGEGIKTVYVKFKNDAGESTTYNDTIKYDVTKPKLSTAVYSDANSSNTVNKGDTITFTFDDEMDTSTITSSNVSSRLPLSAGSYGTGPTVSWNTTGTVCTVTLGTSPTIVSGTTVNPSSSVTDIAGNVDNSSAVTISGLLNVLASVSITSSAASTTTGGAAVILTATALNTAGGNITSLCTFVWTITGVGTISPTTGSAIVYTPPSSGTGIAVITVTAVYAGVTKTATATVIVSASAAAPTAALGGTVITGAPNTEANIVAGGKIITITLTNETWNRSIWRLHRCRSPRDH